MKQRMLHRMAIIMIIVLAAFFSGFVSCTPDAYGSPSDLVVPAARKPEVKVEANRKDLERIQGDVHRSHFLKDHFDWHFDVDRYRSTPKIEWKIDGQKIRSEGWHGVDGFIWQYRNTGGRFT